MNGTNGIHEPGPAPEIIVFFWPGSPWASKVTSYLHLRGISFTECHQPITMPRPILADLGVKYRRIPVVAIGRDIYCDTLLILEKLETLFPEGKERESPEEGHLQAQTKRTPLSAQTPDQKAIEKLLEKWTDAVVFVNAAHCIPLDHPLVKDPNFIKDRTELWGESWERDVRAAKRPEGLVNMRSMFDFLEDTLLVDGREWVLGTTGPTLADIHSAWIFNWMLSLGDSFPDNMVSNETYPRTLAWCNRYQGAVDVATNKSQVVDGDEALKRIAAASFAESLPGVDELDPLSLKEGQVVVVAPTDTGLTGQQEGPLLAVTRSEIVVGSKTKDGTEVHIHAPRWNFRVRPAT